MKAAEKKDAIKKYGLLHTEGQSKADILQAMKDDLISDKDAEEIIDEVSPAKKPEKVKAEPGKVLTLVEKLKEIDYDNLKGEMFKKYCLIVQSLKWNERHTFQQFTVKAIKKVRYKGVAGSPVDIIGVKLEKQQPEITTNIPVKAALLTNGTLIEDEDGEFFEMMGSQISPTGISRFYLLKK